jgi:hypothetical protein
VTDLFGNESPAPRSSVTVPAPIALELFDHAAERAAIASGRAVSQERAELIAPGTVTPATLELGARYVVRPTGTKARPFDVHDTLGGWVCSGHATIGAAEKRARALNGPRRLAQMPGVVLV